jgi:uncharacterized protein (DUF2267 family)
MDYGKFVHEIAQLDYIRNEEEADAAIKAVLGIIVSSLDVEVARRLTDALPHPLTLEKLRSHQARTLAIPADYFFGELSNQFKINEAQAEDLAIHVLHHVKELLPEKDLQAVEEHLPAEMARVQESS